MSFERTTEQLAVPERTLRTLSFCEPTAKHMSEWLEHLPMANIGESSRQLYHAIIEVNKLVCDFDTRMSLLELLRKPIVYVCGALTKYYINQPLVLGDKPRKIARLAMALDNHIAVGYKIAINDYSKSKNLFAARKSKKAAALAVHRAMSALTRTVLRYSQLYNQVPSLVWQELHQLYLIGESNKILDIPVEDLGNQFISKLSIAEVYKRALMLSCCKPNQMQQQDIVRLFDATEFWAKHIALSSVTKQSKFILDLGSDEPPTHREFAEQKATSLHRGIDYSNLIALLNQYLLQSGASKDVYVKGITIPKTVSPDLIRYVVRSCGSLSDRSSSRIAGDKPVQLCIGFSATHYYLAGGVDFETQLHQTAAASKDSAFHGSDVQSLGEVKDQWAGGFDVASDADRSIASAKIIDFNPGIQEPAISPAALGEGSGTDYAIHEAQILDSSPTGYCIKWMESVPDGVRTGEIIGVNEGVEHSWSIGVIRWLNKIGNDETLMGIEIIAPNAVPCGVKVLLKGKRKSDYIRSLIMPGASPASGYPRLITPNLPFRNGLLVLVNQYGEVTQGLLADRETITSRFSKFTFESQMDLVVDDDSDAEPDDIWPDV